MIAMNDCEFIDDRLQFYNYNDFIENRLIIKTRFKKIPYQSKRIYKWYVYANVHMNMIYKNIVWEYLNGDKDDEYVLKMQKRYKPM